MCTPLATFILTHANSMEGAFTLYALSQALHALTWALRLLLALLPVLRLLADRLLAAQLLTYLITR